VSLADASEPRLTAREKEILSLMAKGYSYRQVAGKLGIRNRLMRTLAERIRKKLDP
jgi:DNA-binding CsgD family transcriptional regulator